MCVLKWVSFKIKNESRVFCALNQNKNKSKQKAKPVRKINVVYGLDFNLKFMIEQILLVYIIFMLKIKFFGIMIYISEFSFSKYIIIYII